MRKEQKIVLLIALTFVAIGVVWLLPPFYQANSYQNFADQRTIWGIPNFLNVVSNAPFLLIGYLGLRRVWTSGVNGRGVSMVFGVLFSGVLLTALGSAYYHWIPDNNRLVYDRLPMTLVFMSLLAATVAQSISLSVGRGILWPLIILGIASVYWWHWGDLHGHGDLRLYGLVQFYPMLFIPLIIILFYDSRMKVAVHSLLWVVVWYGLAKVFEWSDARIYEVVGVSGHTLKHLAASVSTGYFIPFFNQVRGKMR